ncbi:ABC transporter substrate-binding protein [Rhodococcoides kyotonense]|uniref:NitT/TauT family transport system substrate-binding protein n=1 Tax=Rhodococcoides kyotonense TaxID=398843 RepID=A0A239LHL9_9NOCA|nr:ABC transporter substrate-binding protein [Rhodococcus kyotonensis]SNT29422.1 NitT/TauT family transport system substrate-binding protein [Rhodococcus kyotonensis]
MTIHSVLKKAAIAAGAAALLTTTACAQGGAAGSPGEVNIAVAGLTNLHNVPLVVADELGYFDEAGVNVSLTDMQSGTKALEAVASGSADVAASFFDHTLRMQSKGQALTAFTVLSDSPGAVLAVPPSSSGSVTTVGDLKGKPVGVAAPGSAEDAYFALVLGQAGLSMSDVSSVSTGTGASAVAALESGQVDAGWMYEPAFSQFEQRNPGTSTLIDTRTVEGNKQMFGDGGYAAETLYAKSAWVDERSDDAGKVASAVKRALEWMSTHTAAEITEVMPENLTGTDREMYTRVLDGTLPMFTKDGKMPTDGYVANVELLEQSQGLQNLDATKAYTNEFVE